MVTAEHIKAASDQFRDYMVTTGSVDGSPDQRTFLGPVSTVHDVDSDDAMSETPSKTTSLFPSVTELELASK